MAPILPENVKKRPLPFPSVSSINGCHEAQKKTFISTISNNEYELKTPTDDGMPIKLLVIDKRKKELGIDNWNGHEDSEITNYAGKGVSCKPVQLFEAVENEDAKNIKTECFTSDHQESPEKKIDENCDMMKPLKVQNISIEESEHENVSVLMTDTSTRTKIHKKKKRKSKKKKIKSVKVDVGVDSTSGSVNFRCCPSSHTSSNNGSTQDQSTKAAVPLYHGINGGQVHNPGGGGGDGDGSDENSTTVNRTCIDNGSRKCKKKKKNSQKSSSNSGSDVEMKSVSDEKPCQTESEEATVRSSTSSSDVTMLDLTVLNTFSNADLQHAAYCINRSCKKQSCSEIKNYYSHITSCNGCDLCEKFIRLLQSHSDNCMTPVCRVPLCKQEQSHSQDKGKHPAYPPSQMPRSAQGNQILYLDYSPNPSDSLPPTNGAVPPQLGHLACRPPVPYCVSGAVGGSPHGHSDGAFFWKDENVFNCDTFEEKIDYQVVKTLGQGSNGIVKKIVPKEGTVKKQELRKRMAIKQTKYEISDMEHLILQILSKDPTSFVKVFGVQKCGASEKGNIIIMEECDTDLHAYLRNVEGHRLPPDEAKFYLHQIIMGLQKMHGMKFQGNHCPVIHKDIKSKNIMITEGRAVIGDLDAAMLLREEMTKPGLKPEGTCMFAAPEVLNQKPHGCPADIYSFGILILEITVGLPREQGKNVQKIQELMQLDHDLGLLAACCTQENPSDRPSAFEILMHPMFGIYRKQ